MEKRKIDRKINGKVCKDLCKKEKSPRTGFWNLLRHE